jgi:hypothetical protein
MPIASSLVFADLVHSDQAISDPVDHNFLISLFLITFFLISLLLIIISILLVTFLFISRLRATEDNPHTIDNSTGAHQTIVLGIPQHLSYNKPLTKDLANITKTHHLSEYTVHDRKCGVGQQLMSQLLCIFCLASMKRHHLVEGLTERVFDDFAADGREDGTRGLLVMGGLFGVGVGLGCLLDFFSDMVMSCFGGDDGSDIIDRGRVWRGGCWKMEG